MKNLLAQVNLGPKGGFQGFGSLGLEGLTAEHAPLLFNQVISHLFYLYYLLRNQKKNYISVFIIKF